MAQVHCFTFNMFYENTYIVYDETNTLETDFKK